MADPEPNIKAPNKISKIVDEKGNEIELDCYPYTFSPLLLFSQERYFEKGYSNFNAVAEFFSTCLPPGMDLCVNVLYERKNMRYEELLDYVAENRMTGTAVIDSHSTAFQVLPNEQVIFYDPLSSDILLMEGKSYLDFLVYMCLKCKYGDSAHIQDNKKYYVGSDATETRKVIYRWWKNINDLQLNHLRLRTSSVRMDLDKYFLINNKREYGCMSTQETGNTCYFQTYLFVLLCKICKPQLARDQRTLVLSNTDQLRQVTVEISLFLLRFFVENSVMRPLTNNNFLLDFHRYEGARYYDVMVRYLQHCKVAVPDYEEQYHQVLTYYTNTKKLHLYEKFGVSGKMSSVPNTRKLQPVVETETPRYKLFLFNYYKTRAANLMFGFNTYIMKCLRSFNEFNALRKNQLLPFYDQLRPIIGKRYEGLTKYRDFYFMPQFEIGQKELVDLHHYTYEIDMYAMLGKNADRALAERIRKVNTLLMPHVIWSTNRSDDYDQFQDIRKSKFLDLYLDYFMSPEFFSTVAGLGLSSINPKEKEFNSLTQTAFYSVSMIRQNLWRLFHEFTKECINQMAKSTLNGYVAVFDSPMTMKTTYKVEIPIGHGFTYSKYNTLMHFLNVMRNYWHNPDVNSLQVFGKDVRTLLFVSCCQKIFFDPGHTYYHYGCVDDPNWRTYDLAMASAGGAVPSVCRHDRSGGAKKVLITDRVYEYTYLKNILKSVFDDTKGAKVKSDDAVLNLSLLSLLLDFGLYGTYADCLNLPFLHSLKRKNTRELQVEVSNMIGEFDKNNKESVSRIHVEELINEASHKFMINRYFDLNSREFQVINTLNSDPGVYHRYLMLCKIYISLCQINKSTEVDYYKIKCNNEYRIVIPQSFSKVISDYLELVTKRHNFSEKDGFISHDETKLFDVRRPEEKKGEKLYEDDDDEEDETGGQPKINLYKVRFDSGAVSSLVKYLEVSNAFRALVPCREAVSSSSSSLSSSSSSLSLSMSKSHGKVQEQYLIFIADSTLLVDVEANGSMTLRVNEIPIEIATVYFNKAISFVPCFKYQDSEDVILFASPNIHYLVDTGGQYNQEYYGMKHELIENIKSVQSFIDLNDEHVFKKVRLNELRTESKTVLYYPDYLMQVTGRQQLINLLDLSIYIRNVSMFILVLTYLRRVSIYLEYIESEHDFKKITGPWLEAIKYVLKRAPNDRYDEIFAPQFFDLNQHKNLPLVDFIDVMAENFTRYQQYIDGRYQIIPTQKQKNFLAKIIKAEECFHFSAVGSGKTKVILPLLCQIFLSNNAEAHHHFACGGLPKQVLVVLVPEHLVNDAISQVFRYCLNLNYDNEYRVYDDIFALLHDKVNIRGTSGRIQKQIYVTSFNLFKKALTYDVICRKLYPEREHVLVMVDEVDDFLDRDKLVFNICSNKNNSFKNQILEFYFAISRAVYKKSKKCPDLLNAANPSYWKELFEKFQVIDNEVQEKSHAINKSFGIFNGKTLRHCATNIAHDIEGYKSLIARPYESVNRAMPGSYYTDVERTIYLTYYILMEDISKYDDLFQQERKFISFEYYQSQKWHIEFDDLVYGSTPLSQLVIIHPETKNGLSRYLYSIILRKMEIRDKSRSVNSIDVVFNFDCLGFTGTPFIDNYPTFAYIKRKREDTIPSLIDRSFYVYGNQNLSQDEFEDKFSQFQNDNNNVLVDYLPSEFISEADDESAILQHIFELESSKQSEGVTGFNVLVDLCGIFKKTSIFEVRDLVLKHFGSDKFKYIYHIDQADGSDRVLYVNSDNDVQYDEEFYKYLCHGYGAELREKCFFFIDNRNVIGKDIPFQLIYQRRFKQPLFFKSIVLAHDVDDFSKIWQAMGRSRTMNSTLFSIYKNGIDSFKKKDGKGKGKAKEGEGRPGDIKKHPLTRLLYVKNCDRKIIGNLSSIYQTIISLFNLSQKSFYYVNEINNVFLEKMEDTIEEKVQRHERKVGKEIFEQRVPSGIFAHIIGDKLQRSEALAKIELTPKLIPTMLTHIIHQKFEHRFSSNDIFDDVIRFLSGEQMSLMEISYTKQQQKQKQKQKNKNQDSDTMETFKEANQMKITEKVENYFEYTRDEKKDLIKSMLNLPISVPIMQLSYSIDGVTRHINVYPTLQFLYSIHIQPQYITDQVRRAVASTQKGTVQDVFLKEVFAQKQPKEKAASGDDMEICVKSRYIRQNPQFSLAALDEGIYVIGMKNQFNIFDLLTHPLSSHIRYISDEMGFVLYDRERSSGDGLSVDKFGPYHIELYLLIEELSKHEVAQNVLEYYISHREKLENCLKSYDESKGKGFICWRFIVTQTQTQEEK